MFKNVFAALVLALVATPVLAQEEQEVSATLAPSGYTFSTPLAPGVSCRSSDAVARIEMAAVYAREDNPDADAETLNRLIRGAVQEKIAQLSDGITTFPDGTVAPIDECTRTGHSS